MNDRTVFILIMTVLNTLMFVAIFYLLISLGYITVDKKEVTINQCIELNENYKFVSLPVLRGLLIKHSHTVQTYSSCPDYSNTELCGSFPQNELNAINDIIKIIDCKESHIFDKKDL